jgi:hypothetical protein
MATKLSAFGQAFADARKEGLKTFEFNGKKYGTKLASEVEQPSVGGKVSREYKPRDSDARKGENATSKNTVPRDEYVRSGRKSFDTDTEVVPPDMSNYKPRRTPEDLTSTTKPGTRVNYENTDTSDMGMKRGGKVKGYAKGGVTRADGCITKGHTKGRVI